MAIITDGGGGGSTLGACATSPFDQQTTIDNILSRMEELERIVSQMLGYDVTAGQLSDISQQVGWVYGITYMGTPGWIQTAAGTLIPPPGWTFSSSGLLTDSDGNLYQGVLMDSDGVLQYGYTASGGISGVYGGVGKVDIYYGADEITYSSSPGTIRKFTNLIVTDDNGLVTTAADGKVTFTSTGYYLVQTTIEVDYPVAAGTNKKFLHGLGEGSGWYAELFQEEEVTGQSGIYNFIDCCIFRNDGTPNFFYVQVADTGDASGTRTCSIRQMAIVKLAGI